MSGHFHYVPIPAPFPRMLNAAGRYLQERARPVPCAPLGLCDETLEAATVTSVSEVVIPTDLLIAAWRQLFPAERMVFLSGHRLGQSTRLTSVRDVTGSTRSDAYVKACPNLLRESLLDFEAAGAPVAAWLHSHPGQGRGATHPSGIDWRQDAALRQDYGPRLVGLIATVDGWLRGWGQALADGTVHIRLEGRGISEVSGEPHVYRLAVR